jgi:hypothetical protein
MTLMLVAKRPIPIIFSHKFFKGIFVLSNPIALVWRALPWNGLAKQIVLSVVRCLSYRPDTLLEIPDYEQKNVNRRHLRGGNARGGHERDQS